MKKVIFIIACLVSSGMFAQLEGMRYQAVITSPSPQEIPGWEPLDNILPNEQLQIRFTIYDTEGIREYEEVHNTRTNDYGMIDIIIGQGAKTARSGRFIDLLWFGEPKELMVEVNLRGAFEALEKQELLFVPYAYHRDLIVTKDMVVDGTVQFAGNLIVEGSTTLNNSLSVLNESDVYLSGRLRVEGQTRLNDTLIVANESETLLRGTLEVDQATQLESRLNVAGSTALNNSLDVDGRTLIDDSLTVANGSETQLTGELKVGGETNFNGNVSIQNDSDLNVSGDLLIGGATTFDGDLTVDGMTQLNNALNVNNQTPTLITGSLTVDKATTLGSSLQVFERTQLEGSLNVNNESPTHLTGTLTVDGVTNLNDGLDVNNNSHVVFTGDLTIGGSVVHEDDLTVLGKTNFNDALFVNNNAPTALTGTLAAGDTSINQTLNVNGPVTMFSALEVLNASPTRFSGILNVTNATVFYNTLTVANSSASALNGSLTVEGETTLNNSLNVANAASTELSGLMTVDGATRMNKMAVNNGSGTSLTGDLQVELSTTLDSSLLVAGGVSTQLTGTLEVDGFTVLNDPLTVSEVDPTSLTGTLEVIGVSNLQETVLSNGAVLIENSLTVNGLTALESISAEQIAVSGNIADQGDMVDSDYVAIFENDNTSTGDGIEIRLGKQHGALIGSNTYANISNPIFPLLNNAVTVIGGKLENLSPSSPPSGPFITPTEVLQMVPAAALAGTAAGLANTVVQTLNSRLGLPVSTPAIAIPGRRLLNEIVFFGGISEQCTGQYCFDPCPGPIDCDICVPPVAFCLPAIPRIAFPEVNMPTIPILPAFNNIIPAIPTVPVTGLDPVQFPDIQTSVDPNSLTEENAFVTFQDNMGREAGSISGQSFADFKDATIGDNIYVLNIAAEFVGVDLLGGLTSGSVALTNLIDEYNKIGVSYNSGNGDYAEWLERRDPLEHLTAGDIVGVRGGKITKDITNAEQLMVVSHQPIVLGNHPDMDRRHLGNSVAFIGQVPVKVMGAVESGDYIVTHPKLAGYGVAIAPENMQASDHAKVVGRSWETKPKVGFKLVNTVVGVQNGDWNAEVNKLVSKQHLLDRKVESLEEKLARIEANLNAADDVQPIYASNDE